MRIKSSVSIIIANYNGEKCLEICLQSLIKSSFDYTEIVIVDDASTDRSLDIITLFQKKHPKIILLQNETNHGAAASRNRAIQIAKGEVFVFLDNDTEVDTNWLTELIVTLMSSPSIGASQSLLIDYENRDKIQNAGMKLWAATAWGLPFHQWEKNRGQIKDSTDIIAVSAALGVKRELCLKTGGFDEDEAVFTEDIDFSWRIWLLGYRVVVSPKSIVYHWTKSISRRKNMKHTETKVYFHLTKNSLISILKNYEIANALKFFCYSVCISLLRAILILFKRKKYSSLLGTLQGITWVLFHLPLILFKRSKIQKSRKTSDKMLFRNIILDDSPFTIYKTHFTGSGLL